MTLRPGRAAGLLVTGTDTGAGKTYVASLLGRRIAAGGTVVVPLKPVESGCPRGPDGRPFPSDAAALRDAFAPDLSLEEVCPYPLSLPLSPHLAARREGKTIATERLCKAFERAAGRAEFVLVEGAGGIAVEIREGYAFGDLARDLSLPVLVVAENRLGVLNHLRLTLSYLDSKGLRLFGVVLNDRTGRRDPAFHANGEEAPRIAGERFLGRVPFGAAALPEESFGKFRELALSEWPSLSLK
jgi:dethiobiotin synthetase